VLDKIRQVMWVIWLLSVGSTLGLIVAYIVLAASE